MVAGPQFGDASGPVSSALDLPPGPLPLPLGSPRFLGPTRFLYPLPIYLYVGPYPLLLVADPSPLGERQTPGTPPLRGAWAGGRAEVPTSCRPGGLRRRGPVGLARRGSAPAAGGGDGPGAGEEPDRDPGWHVRVTRSADVGKLLSFYPSYTSWGVGTLLRRGSFTQELLLSHDPRRWLPLVCRTGTPHLERRYL